MRSNAISRVPGGMSANKKTGLGPFPKYVGAEAQQNGRPYMEDFYDICFYVERQGGVALPPTHYFGVFDGHGGSATADYLARELVQNVSGTKEFREGKLREAVEVGHEVTNSQLVRECHTDYGSTCCTAWLRGNEILVANLGDTRAVLSRSGQAYQLSHDHKPDRPSEKARIERLGGYLSHAPCEWGYVLNLTERYLLHWSMCVRHSSR